MFAPRTTYVFMTDFTSFGFDVGTEKSRRELILMKFLWTSQNFSFWGFNWGFVYICRTTSCPESRETFLMLEVLPFHERKFNLQAYLFIWCHLMTPSYCNVYCRLTSRGMSVARLTFRSQRIWCINDDGKNHAWPWYWSSSRSYNGIGQRPPSAFSANC